MKTDFLLYSVINIMWFCSEKIGCAYLSEEAGANDNIFLNGTDLYASNGIFSEEAGLSGETGLTDGISVGERINDGINLGEGLGADAGVGDGSGLGAGACIGGDIGLGSVLSVGLGGIRYSAGLGGNDGGGWGSNVGGHVGAGLSGEKRVARRRIPLRTRF
ncbi:hypothetical protein LUQ84_001715 [Hamiltosporidium tvaerminnensis]|nr:hypothetical protein LUQ84_001715 [Hamiltosporidium tvaerminnensis]